MSIPELEAIENIIRDFYGADDNAYEAAADLTKLIWPRIEYIAQQRFIGLINDHDRRNKVIADQNEILEFTYEQIDARDKIIADAAWDSALYAGIDYVKKIVGGEDFGKLRAFEVYAALNSLRAKPRT